VQKITPYLWFDTQAEEAAKFYVEIFDNSRILEVARYGPAGPGPEGTAMNVVFELEGQKFIALNGGPHFKFNEAVSFYVECETQEDVDELWNKLTAHGGEESMCGWLKDRYGLSWQIIPQALPELLGDPDPDKAACVMQAMLQMSKIDVSELERAHARC
jgi:predicted 3-demethylubiquinone-9 3-methyltransferase (glyoxalase superfamily)